MGRATPANSGSEGSRMITPQSAKMRGFGFAQQPGGLLNQRVDLFSKTHIAYRRSGQAVTRGAEKFQSAIGPGDRYMIDFGEIVIVGGEPEYGHRVDSRGRGFLGQFHGGERLVE